MVVRSWRCRTKLAGLVVAEVLLAGRLSWIFSVVDDEKQKLPDGPMNEVSPSYPIFTFHNMEPISSTAEVSHSLSAWSDSGLLGLKLS
jgi:hypothetical protein